MEGEKPSLWSFRAGFCSCRTGNQGPDLLFANADMQEHSSGRHWQPHTDWWQSNDVGSVSCQFFNPLWRVWGPRNHDRGSMCCIFAWLQSHGPGFSWARLAILGLPMLSSHRNLAISLNQSVSFKPSVNCLHRIFKPEGGDGFLIVGYKKINWSLSGVWIILGCRENLWQARGIFQGLWCCYPWTFFHQPEGRFFCFFFCVYISRNFSIVQSF